jgi:hypothetical protein
MSMGASLHYQVLRDTKHEDFLKHMAVNKACLDAGIKKLPEETAAYFGLEYPECESEMENRALEIANNKLNGAVREMDEEYRDGYEVDISKLPKDAKVIRFFVSY